MKNLLALIICLLFVGGCKKGRIDPVNAGAPRLKTALESYFEGLADHYAFHTWDGDAVLYNDTFYFSYTDFLHEPDSLPYRATILDQQAPEAFRFIFKQVPDKPATWRACWFFFGVQFFHDDLDTTIEFRYPLNQEILFHFP